MGWAMSSNGNKEQGSYCFTVKIKCQTNSCLHPYCVLFEDVGHDIVIGHEPIIGTLLISHFTFHISPKSINSNVLSKSISKKQDERYLFSLWIIVTLFRLPVNWLIRLKIRLLENICFWEISDASQQQVPYVGQAYFEILGKIAILKL